MRKVAKIAIAAISLVLGFITGQWVIQSAAVADIFPGLVLIKGFLKLLIYGFASVLFGIIYYFVYNFMWKHGSKVIRNLGDSITQNPPTQIIGGSLGLLAGMILAYFVSSIFRYLDNNVLSVALSVVTYAFFGTLGLLVGSKLATSVEFPNFDFKRKVQVKQTKTPVPKVLDTSAIIDGRIVEISRTGFIEGELVVPNFVLNELRHIADSSDDLTRAKGRRGLDFVNELKEIGNISLSITDRDFKEVEEVDIKLLHLASELGGAVITTDYNLNKVALLRQIPVLNVNDLSNAVKPNALPGQNFTLEIIKEGKEVEQGVGYLEDGTMVVVDQAKSHVGEILNVEVTSSLQTPAGRMIFAKIKEEE